MLLDFLLPYSAVDTRNPIFRQMRLHLRFVNTEARLQRFNQIILIGLPLIAVLWWLIERFNLNFGAVELAFSYRLVNFFLFAALIVMGISSLYSLSRIMGRFNAQFNSAYWDSLRLTPQYNSTILMSHDAIAQLRLWPFTALEISLRIAIVAIYTLNNFYDLYHTYPQQSFIAQTLLNPTCLGMWGLILFIGILFTLEPIMRVRLIIAFQLTIAVHIRNVPLAFLTGLLTIAIIHLVQLLLMVCLVTLYQAFTVQEMGSISIAVCFVPLTFVVFIALRALYHWLRKAALDLAYKSAFRQD